MGDRPHTGFQGAYTLAILETNRSLVESELSTTTGFSSSTGNSAHPTPWRSIHVICASAPLRLRVKTHLKRFG